MNKVLTAVGYIFCAIFAFYIGAHWLSAIIIVGLVVTELFLFKKNKKIYFTNRERKNKYNKLYKNYYEQSSYYDNTVKVVAANLHASEEVYGEDNPITIEWRNKYTICQQIYFKSKEEEMKYLIPLIEKIDYDTEKHKNQFNNENYNRKDELERRIKQITNLLEQKQFSIDKPIKEISDLFYSVKMLNLYTKYYKYILNYSFDKKQPT